MEMTRPSCLRVPERTDAGLVSVVPMKDEAWREEEAGGIRFRITKSIHPAQHLQAASCPSGDSGLKTSVKGEARETIEGKR